MSNLLYNFETVEAFVSENLAIFRECGGNRTAFFFTLALVELLYDPNNDRHWLVALDLASNKKARMWPMMDLTDWKAIRDGAA